jgi:translation initiation factor 2 beta subunit (eIF-2beta)/eIF-5
MSARIRVQYGTVCLEVDAESPKDAIKELSSFSEVFVGHKCGLCGSVDVRWEHREHNEHDYYSVNCVQCGADRSFGQHKNGRTLFAKGEWSIFDRQQSEGF